MSAARRAAVEIVAAFGPFGRRLDADSVPAIEACIERHLAGAQASCEEVICRLCERPVDDDSIEIDGERYCPRCFLALDMARKAAPTGRVLVFRCQPILAGTESCGRVWDLYMDDYREGGPIVQETSRVCPQCRSQQIVALARLGGVL